MNTQTLLTNAFKRGASDVLITAGSPPVYRVHGALEFLDDGPIDAEAARRFASEILSDVQLECLDEKRELDFSLTHSDHRFRGNAYWQSGAVAVALRLIPDSIPTPQALGIPTAVIDLLHRPQGLILVTGASDQGKTTTQASLIDYINRTAPKHVITLEDPIEFVHHNEKCVVDQRELGIDTLSFAEGLRHALRQTPDIILVGEMRDPETIRAALTAAETGHLVISTLHTNDACQALDRIIDVFPEHQQSQIRSQLSMCLIAVLAQRLVRTVDGHLVLAMEILQNSRAVSNLIREGKIPLIYGTMEVNRQHGMQTLNQALEALVRKGVVREAEAAKYESEFETRRVGSSA
jgi:twitching motility protein PilT